MQNLSVPQDPRVWREARSLAAEGYSVAVICPRAAGQSRREFRDDVRVERFPVAPALDGVVGLTVETAWTLIWTLVFLVGMRLRGRIDVLHAANPPDTYVLLAWLLRPFGTRFVFDQHDVCPELLQAKGISSRAAALVIGALERASYRSAELVVTPNESYREIAITRGGVDPSRMVVVRTGPDDVVADHRRASDDTPFEIAFAGAIDDQDGVDTLLEAVAELGRTRPARLLVMGRGSAVPRLKAFAAELGVADDVSWLGWVDRSVLRDHLRRAAVAVSPDPDTPFSRLSTMTKVHDYLAAGVPAVVADLPENRRTAGDAVAYFPAGDGRALARVIGELLDDANRRDRLAAAAAARAGELVWDRCVLSLLDAYRTTFPLPNDERAGAPGTVPAGDALRPMRSAI